MLEGHTNSVTSVAISPDGKRAFIQSNYDETINWNLVAGEKLEGTLQLDIDNEQPTASEGRLVLGDHGSVGFTSDFVEPWNRLGSIVFASHVNAFWVWQCR